jgi:integrase
VRAYAHDLKVFFDVVGKDVVEVTPAEVLAFVSSQQRPRAGAENLVRISDGASGLSAATIKRRLATVSSLYGYLLTRGDAGVVANPVPRGLPTRRARRRGQRAPLVRGVRRLPRILDPAEVEALMAALRTERDRAMIRAGPRRSAPLRGAGPATREPASRRVVAMERVFALGGRSPVGPSGPVGVHFGYGRQVAEPRPVDLSSPS